MTISPLPTNRTVSYIGGKRGRSVADRCTAKQKIAGEDKRRPLVVSYRRERGMTQKRPNIDSSSLPQASEHLETAWRWLC
ncbi:hypothetical protein, partial [Providencia alcalifaciens]|uniref:hypothetical protein n=1 Tax=Providencia alcalifaciens TaxID=126385 RepID=UPI002B0575CE